MPDNPWDSRLSPENARGVRMLPENAAGVPISPENARDVRMPPENAMPMHANGCAGGGAATERMPPCSRYEERPSKAGPFGGV